MVIAYRQGDSGRGLHARPGEVEEMIQRRLEERHWLKRRRISRRRAGKSCGMRSSA
jgi:hypothetical protein